MWPVSDNMHSDWRESCSIARAFMTEDLAEAKREGRSEGRGFMIAAMQERGLSNADISRITGLTPADIEKAAAAYADSLKTEVKNNAAGA